jgi:hypothetical protein
VRAALTRRDAAIRDFFDVGNAIQSGRLNLLDPEFICLVQRKLAVTADAIDTSDAKKKLLTGQLATQLKPVLRVADFNTFTLDSVFATLEEVATLCKSQDETSNASR